MATSGNRFHHSLQHLRKKTLGELASFMLPLTPLERGWTALCDLNISQPDPSYQLWLFEQGLTIAICLSDCLCNTETQQ